MGDAWKNYEEPASGWRVVTPSDLEKDIVVTVEGYGYTTRPSVTLRLSPDGSVTWERAHRLG